MTVGAVADQEKPREATPAPSPAPARAPDPPSAAPADATPAQDPTPVSWTQPDRVDPLSQEEAASSGQPVNLSWVPQPVPIGPGAPAPAPAPLPPGLPAPRWPGQEPPAPDVIGPKPRTPGPDMPERHRPDPGPDVIGPKLPTPAPDVIGPKFPTPAPDMPERPIQEPGPVPPNVRTNRPPGTEEDPLPEPRKPGGRTTPLPKPPDENATPEEVEAYRRNVRDIEHENSSAQTLAGRDYDVVQNPDARQPDRSGFTPKPGKNPDYTIDGNYFDCYAPKPETDAWSVAQNAGSKAGKGQTERVVIDMSDNGANPDEVIENLSDPGVDASGKLKEAILILPNGEIRHVVRGENGKFAPRG